MRSINTTDLHHSSCNLLEQQTAFSWSLYTVIVIAAGPDHHLGSRGQRRGQRRLGIISGQPVPELPLQDSSGGGLPFRPEGHHQAADEPAGPDLLAPLAEEDPVPPGLLSSFASWHCCAVLALLSALLLHEGDRNMLSDR